MLIDLSREVTNTVGEPDEVTITVLTHEDGAELLGERFGMIFLIQWQLIMKG